MFKLLRFRVMRTAREYHQLLVELVWRNGVLRSHSSLLPQSVRLLKVEPEKSTWQLSTGIRRCRV